MRWVHVSQINAGWYINRWGDWLKVLSIEHAERKVTITVLDTNPQDGIGKPIERSWEYATTDELIAAPYQVYRDA